MCEDYTLVDETRHAQRAPCSACGKKAANLVSIDSGPLICTPCALAAARRAGAEEMRERCAKAAQEAPDTWTSLSDLRWQQSIAYKCASAIRALHPNAKGGERRETQRNLGHPLPGMPEWVNPAQPDASGGDHA